MMLICGVDEAGRGPLAGPVFAAAVVLGAGAGADDIEGIADSKRLSAARRDALARLIKAQAQTWAIASASVAEIDHMNILEATMLAMLRAIRQLTLPVGARIVIDGVTVPRELPSWAAARGIEFGAQVRADAEVRDVGAASILAKTARDAFMVALDRRYPQYAFARHKGYGTAAHLAAIAAHGACPEHRMSFAPLRAR